MIDIKNEFKKYPLNDLYAFSLNGSYTYGGVLQDRRARVAVETKYGVIELPPKSFALISHFELDYPIDEYSKLRFIETDSRIRRSMIGYYVEHTDPITVGCDPGYRRIPGYNEYAINESGDVMNIYTKKILSTRTVYGYQCVNIRRPITGRFGQGRIHVLLASTFIPNPRHCDVVNHIDGNRSNNKLENLEWVTSSENARHCVASGSWSTSRSCKLRDITTGEVYSFPSIADAGRFIGYGAGLPYSVKYKGGQKIPLLLRRRYEYKDASDDSPWYYTSDASLRSDSTGPYEIRDVLSKEVITFTRLLDIADYLGVKVGRVYTAHLTDGRRALLGYQIRTKSDDPWPEYRVASDNKSKEYTTYRISDGAINHYSSGSKLAKALYLDRTMMRNAADNNIPLKGYLIFNGYHDKISPDLLSPKPPLIDGEVLKLGSLSHPGNRGDGQG